MAVIWEGARDLDLSNPRPRRSPLLIARDMAGVALVASAAASLTLLAFAVLS